MINLPIARNTNAARMKRVAAHIQAFETGGIMVETWKHYDGTVYKNYRRVTDHTFKTREHMKNGKLHQDTIHVFQTIDCNESGAPIYPKYDKGIRDECQISLRRWTKIDEEAQ